MMNETDLPVLTRDPEPAAPPESPEATEPMELPSEAPSPERREGETPELVPSPPDASASPEPAKETLLSVIAWLGHAIPAALGGFALLVSAAAALFALVSSGITGDRIVRALLEEAAGGADNLIPAVVLPAEPDEGDPGSLPLTPFAEADFPADPFPEAEEPAEEAIPEEESRGNPDPGGMLRLTDETGLLPDMSSLLERERAVPVLDELRAAWGEDAPLVLILHTHTTEGYAESAAADYRSADPAASVVSVGALLAQRLEDAGIPAIHLTETFDTPDFGMAYFNAASAIRRILGEHPSIRYIFDIHRDSVLLPDGTVWAARTEIDGRETGQLMFVVGTNAAGADHPAWEDNLALAARLQTALRTKYPALMRDINLRSASFNEQYAPGALLIEAGSSGCTAEEAQRGMNLLADALIGEIRG